LLKTELPKDAAKLGLAAIPGAVIGGYIGYNNNFTGDRFTSALLGGVIGGAATSVVGIGAIKLTPKLLKWIAPNIKGITTAQALIGLAGFGTGGAIGYAKNPSGNRLLSGLSYGALTVSGLFILSKLGPKAISKLVGITLPKEAPQLGLAAIPGAVIGATSATTITSPAIDLPLPC